MEYEVRAVAKYLRLSPRKVRLVIDEVRGMQVDQALNYLRLCPRAAARPVAKTIASAVKNAEENHEMSRSDLYVSYIVADEGPTLKRRRFGARARFKPILKRSTHITVGVREVEE